MTFREYLIDEKMKYHGPRPVKIGDVYTKGDIEVKVVEFIKQRVNSGRIIPSNKVKCFSVHESKYHNIPKQKLQDEYTLKSYTEW